MNNLRKIFQQNCYTTKDITRACNTKTTKEKEKEERSLTTVFLPYISGTTDKIGRMLKKHNIKTVFKTTRKLNSFFRSVKDKIPQEDCGVYRIPCDCGEVYIGQTKKALKERIKEHKRSAIHLSAVSLHSTLVNEHGIKHNILYDEARVIDPEMHRWKRAISEGLEIIKHTNNMNGDDCGYRFSDSWSTAIALLSKTEKRKPKPVKIGQPESTHPVTNPRYNLRNHVQ